MGEFGEVTSVVRQSKHVGGCSFADVVAGAEGRGENASAAKTMVSSGVASTWVNNRMPTISVSAV